MRCTGPLAMSATVCPVPRHRGECRRPWRRRYFDELVVAACRRVVQRGEAAEVARVDVGPEFLDEELHRREPSRRAHGGASLAAKPSPIAHAGGRVNRRSTPGPPSGTGGSPDGSSRGAAAFGRPSSPRSAADGLDRPDLGVGAVAASSSFMAAMSVPVGRAEEGRRTLAVRRANKSRLYDVNQSVLA
jgi:hypothetical protein